MISVEDIVIIKSTNKEGLVFGFAQDIHTNEEKIIVVDENDIIYLCNFDDIIKVDTLENRLSEYESEQYNAA